MPQRPAQGPAHHLAPSLTHYPGRLSAHTVLLAALVLTAPGDVDAQWVDRRSASDAAIGRTVDSLAQGLIDAGEAVGLSVLVMRGTDTVRAAGYGMADVAARRPVTPQTVFRIGSITKQFTAAAILRLVEQGRITLDDPITRHLPDYPVQGRTVTVRQLLNHTSGIQSYTAMPSWAFRAHRAFTPDSLIAMFAGEPFNFEPGTAFRYNNSGYAILGRIIERLTGTTYAAHLEREIFPRAGLRATRYCPDVPVSPGDATGYAAGGKSPPLSRPLSMSGPYAAGAICSTVLDLARWQDALTSGRVVAPASYAAMTTLDTSANGQQYGYGFGLSIRTDNGYRAIAHNGGISGFGSSMTWMPDDSATIVVLANVGTPVSDKLDAQLRRVMTGRALLPAPSDLPISRSERARYVGAYALTLPNAATLAVRVFEQADQLMAQAVGEPPFRLLRQGGHHFVASTNAGIALRFTVDGDRATALTIEQGERAFTGPRSP